MHLQYSWLNSLGSLELDGWEVLSRLDVSYNQLNTLSLQNNPHLSQLVYLNVSGNQKLRSLAGIQLLQPTLAVLYASRCSLGDASVLEDFKHLEELDLSHNLLTTFPQRLPGLKKLNLRGNLITSLPDGLCDAVGLVELNLQGLQLKSVPPQFGQLVNMERLNLRANKLSHVSGVEQMTNLKFLDLTKPGNSISFVLCDLSTLRSITEIRLAGMKLTAVPDSILDLPSLFYLDLVQNAITTVPTSDTLLSHAVPWRRVNLAFNSLTEFPVDLLYLPGLEQLCIRNNVFELEPLLEALDPTDALNHWRTQYNITLTSSRRTSASSETLGPLVQSELLQLSGPSADQTNFQEYLWFDLYMYRSDDMPSLPIPEYVFSELGRELLLDRIAGCLYGQALGDAIGLATEFMPKDMANFYYDAERGFDLRNLVPDPHRSNFESGDWTDDTDQCILILNNLVQHRGQFEPLSFAQSLLHWMNHGFNELNDTAGCGCGQHTFNVISHASFKTKPTAAATAVWEKSGRASAPNGAVMRTAIVGCAQFWNPDKVISTATAAAQVTHADPRCVASAVAVSSAIASLIGSSPSSTFIERVEGAIQAAEESSKSLLQTCPENQREEFVNHFHAKSLKFLQLSDPKTMGYTLKALGSGFYALREGQHDTFENIITRIVLEAGDADTNASVAGALLGAMIGFRALPAQWVAQLRHAEWLNAKIKSFMDIYGICLEI